MIKMHNDHIMLLTVGAVLLLICSCTQSKNLNNSTTNASDINDSEQIELDNLGQRFSENCSEYILEKEYVILENGSLLLPNFSKLYEYETFFLHNDTAFLCVEYNKQSQKVAVEPLYDFSEEFLRCGKVLIDSHEYKLLENGSVHVSPYSKVYGSRDYYIVENGVYVCVPLYENMEMNMSREETLARHLNKFSESFVYVTYAGLMLSIISLMSHLVVFCLVSSVRNLPGCCLASLSLSLLLAYLCFLALALVEGDIDHCANLGLCVYYFFLTSFFWMNAIAFDVWRSFRVVMRELRISSHRVPWRRFLLYSLYSWLVPAALVVFVKVADSTDLIPDEFKPSFGAPLCWFGRRKALLVFFAVPLIIVMVLNGFFFLDVTCVISRATLKTSQSHEATLKKRFFMFMRLALIMGLTWIVGLLAGSVNQPFMWYLFVILNTLQGVFIFVVFSLSSKVRGLCCKKYRKHSKASTNTSVRTISAAV